MLPRIGINGFGRIGRMLLRAAVEERKADVVAINDPFMSPEYMAYLLKFDSTHGVFPHDVRYSTEVIFQQGGIIKQEPSYISVNGERIRVFAEKSPDKILWEEARANYIAECSGRFSSTEACMGHLKAGGKKVVISASTKDDTPVYVMGVNQDKYRSDVTVISNASCTTNCIAPLAKVIQDHYGIVEGSMTTIHSTTSSQSVVDGLAKDEKNWRAGRAASVNIIPSKSEAAKTVGKIIKELKGKLTGTSFRVPTINVSCLDLTVKLMRPTNYEHICKVIKDASLGNMKVCFWSHTR